MKPITANLARRMRLNGYILPIENEYNSEELKNAVKLLNEGNDKIREADSIIFDLAYKEEKTFFQVEDLVIDPYQRQMVFCAIYTNGTSFNNELLEKSERGKNVPLVLMLMRWDGFLGFPGGNVDFEETLEEALKRELLEEINYEIDLKDNVNVLCSLSNSEKTIHCFKQEVSLDKFKQIIKNATNGSNFLKETQGCFGVQIANFEKDFGINQFVKHNFKGTALIEFNKLVEFLKEKQ